MSRFWGGLLRLPLYFVLVIATLWAAGALFFDLPIAWLRGPLALIYGLAMFAALFFVRGRWRAMSVVALGFAVVLAWWLTLKPTGNKAWQPDVARTAWADIQSDKVTLHDVRNFDYRTETDYTERWETREVELSKLTGVDLSITYWGSPWIAHPIVSFLFSGALPVAFSIETRKAVGQNYSVIAGLYRQYELICITADERDLIRLRTNYRKGEDVFLYRTVITPDHGRALFLAYLNRLNRMHEHPEFYNQLTDNCTTEIRVANIEARQGKVAPWNWRLLLNGKSDELLYERGAIDRSLPFATLKERSLINKKAQAADASPDFSQLIRVGLPQPVFAR
ncbi:MAG TPA: DUF4105 domain-containing protein [Chthoniobacterales bacterium]|nr:DUF4105 domain-containing protein [Chthoniobacterales bacterium]